MKITFAAVEYNVDQDREPSTPFFYEVSFPASARKPGGGVRQLSVKEIARNLAKAILDKVEDEIKESRDPEGAIVIDPKTSWADIEVDLGDECSYIYLTFPGCEGVHNALKKLPKHELTRTWGRDDK